MPSGPTAAGEGHGISEEVIWFRHGESYDVWGEWMRGKNRRYLRNEPRERCQEQVDIYIPYDGQCM